MTLKCTSIPDCAHSHLRWKDHLRCPARPLMLTWQKHLQRLLHLHLPGGGLRPSRALWDQRGSWVPYPQLELKELVILMLSEHCLQDGQDGETGAGNLKEWK